MDSKPHLGRTRKGAHHRREPEPLLHFFWRAAALGVPEAERASMDELNFYLALLHALEAVVAKDHRAGIPGWSKWLRLGSATDGHHGLMRPHRKARGCPPELPSSLRLAMQAS